MKRLFFIIAVVFSASDIYSEENVRVITNDAMEVEGIFINGTDSLYTIRCIDNNMRTYVIKHYGSDTISFRIADIYEVHMYGKVFAPLNGKLVVKKKNNGTQSINQDASATYRVSPSNPNYVVGKALKSTGTTCFGVGIPCMLAGAIMWGVGINKSQDYTNFNSGIKITSAGMYLTAFGSALTVVGIPLCIHGKKIMEIDINYTGNGAGVALQF